MFPSRAPKFRELALLGTTRQGGDDKFDTGHPFYRTIRTLAALRAAHPALARGAMLLRGSGEPHLFVFSRLERSERVEYLVALNNSRTDTVGAEVATSQPAGSVLRVLFESGGANPADGPALITGDHGKVALSLAPLECVIWKAQAALAAPGSAPSVAFAAPAAGSTLTFAARSINGHVIPVRQELRADVTGGDGFAEVTFVMRRASRPGQYELLGTDDAPPYRVFWRPPADLAPGDELTFIATADDLRGHRSSAQIDRIHVSPGSAPSGIRGATVPWLTREPDPEVRAKTGSDLTLAVAAEGTGPLEYRWLHDGQEIAGASQPKLGLKNISAGAAGHYVSLVRNREGTAISREAIVRVDPR
jgi:hypothetical protein